MNTYLVIDIGTSSTRGILYDGEVNKLDVHQVQTSPIYNGDIVYIRMHNAVQGIMAQKAKAVVLLGIGLCKAE